MDIYLLYLSDCLAEKSTQIKTAFLSTAASFYADRATYQFHTRVNYILITV